MTVYRGPAPLSHPKVGQSDEGAIKEWQANPTRESASELDGNEGISLAEAW